MATNTEIEKLERRWLENPLGLTFATLAEAYRKAGNTARALEVLEAGLAQHPNYVPAHIVRGRCHFDTQADTEAEAAFLRVLELDVENVIALKGLAELSERGGRLPEAIRRLEMLIEVDRNNEEARGQLDRVRELVTASVAAPEPVAPVIPEEPAVAPASPWAPESLLVPVEAAAPPPASADDQSFFRDLETMDPEDIQPAAGSEFQIESDAEMLRPTSERIADILLSSDAPILEAGLGSVDGLLGGEYASLIAFEQGSSPEPELAELTPELVPESPPEPAPIVALADVPIVEVVPPPPPAAAVPEPEVEPEQAPDPEPVTAAEEPELVVTETMAEIFLRQGHRELALAVYQQLAQRDPSNQRIAAAVASLTPESPAPEPEPEPEPIPVRVYAAADTGGTSVGAQLSALFKATRPSVAAAIHPPAFETPRRTGEPTRASEERLSLRAVFGDEAGPAGPASPAPGNPGNEPSFDEFFAPATGSSADAELPKAPSEAGAMSAQVPEDLEQFNAWLRGLKR